MPLDGVTTNENDRPPLDKGGLQGGLPRHSQSIPPPARNHRIVCVRHQRTHSGVVAIHSVLWPMLVGATRP